MWLMWLLSAPQLPPGQGAAHTGARPQPHLQVFPDGPRVLGDAQGRFAAMVLYNHHLAILPAIEVRSAGLGRRWGPRNSCSVMLLGALGSWPKPPGGVRVLAAASIARGVSLVSPVLARSSSTALSRLRKERRCTSRRGTRAMCFARALRMRMRRPLCAACPPRAQVDQFELLAAATAAPTSLAAPASSGLLQEIAAQREAGVPLGSAAALGNGYLLNLAKLGGGSGGSHQVRCPSTTHCAQGSKSVQRGVGGGCCSPWPSLERGTGAASVPQRCLEHAVSRLWRPAPTQSAHAPAPQPLPLTCSPPAPTGQRLRTRCRQGARRPHGHQGSARLRAPQRVHRASAAGAAPAGPHLAWALQVGACVGGLVHGGGG